MIGSLKQKMRENDDWSMVLPNGWGPAMHFDRLSIIIITWMVMVPYYQRALVGTR